MQYEDLCRFDINLLIIFDVLMVELNLDKAAQCVSIGLDVMDQNLCDLRELFDDEVFVRSGDELMSTELALIFSPEIRQLLEEVNSFWRHRQF